MLEIKTKDTYNLKKKCLEAKFLGCFSQVQGLNLTKKTLCTFLGYLSIDTKKNKKIPQADYGEKKIYRKKKQRKKTI